MDSKEVVGSKYSVVGEIDSQKSRKNVMLQAPLVVLKYTNFSALAGVSLFYKNNQFD